MKDVIPYAIVLFARGCVVVHCVGCGPSEKAKAAAAEGAYLAEHMKCVEQFNTDPEINACRDAVRVRWGIVTKVRDAGGGP